jgi:hypothetical protein
MRRIIVIVAVVAAGAAWPGLAQAAVISSWPLNDPVDSTVAHDMTDGNDGMASNVEFTATDAIFNKADDSTITVPFNANLSPLDANITAQVSIQTTAMPGTKNNDFDLMRASPTGKMYKIELFPHHGVAQGQCIFIGSLTRTTLHAGPALNDGQWHTITCTKTANQVQLTIATNGAVQTWTTDITIGTIKLRSGRPFALGYKPVIGSADADLYTGHMRDASVAIG